MKKVMSKAQRIKLLEKAKYLATIKKQYDKALEITNDLLAFNGSDIDALRLKGNILDLEQLDLNQNDSRRKSARRYEEARKCYENILGLDRNNPLAYIDLGDYWKRKGENGLAMKHYNRAISSLKKGHFHVCAEEEMEEALSAKADLIQSVSKSGGKRKGSDRNIQQGGEG